MSSWHGAPHPRRRRSHPLTDALAVCRWLAWQGRNYESANRADASRFLSGTPPLTLLPGLLASLDLIDALGGVPAVQVLRHPHALLPASMLMLMTTY